MKEQIIEKDGKKYKVIEVVEDKNKTLIIVNGWDVTQYEKWYDTKYCLEAVKQDGYALQYVKNQTPEICIEAVKQDGYALRFVNNQTPEICIEAVKQNGAALQYVDKRVFEPKTSQEK